MTKEREEQLISDVGETKGLVKRFVEEFDALKPALASHSEVKTVEKKIDEHIENHKWSAGQLVAVITGFGALVVAVLAYVRGGK